jgi:peptide/nickel transport system substrate-binding protein
MSSSNRAASSRTDRTWKPRAAIVIAALMLSVFVAACDSGGDSSSSDSSGPSASGTGTPVTGGTLTFARSLDADVGLNPISAPSNGSIFTLQQIFDQLVEVNGSELVPGLAKSWDTSADGKTWTFHLRDAQFSNGDPVTPEDVKFSIERFADPKINTNYATLGASIDSVDVVDDHTVQVNLNRVDGAFLDNIAMFAAAIVPQKVVEDIGDKAFSDAPVGSGPFMVKDYKRGQHTILVRNPNYWREGQPYLDEIDFEFVPDSNTRTLELRSGEVDVADAIPYNQVESLDAADGVSVEVADSLKWDSIFLDTQKPPLDEVEVRQALAYATPTDQILDAVLFGNAQVANSQIPRVKYWDESVQPYPYDIDKAKELLGQSSVPDGFDIELQIPSGDAVEKQEAEIIKSEWAKIGVNVTIVPRDFGTMFGDWLAGKGGEAATFPGDALSSDTLSDDEIAALMFDPKSGLNSLGTFYENPKIDDLLADASGTLDEDKRQQDFSEIQQIGMDDVPSVPLFFTKSVTGYQDSVQNFQTYPIGWWPLREVWISQ